MPLASEPMVNSIAMPFSDPAAIEGGLYVHVPFCLEKCGYCDFYSLALDESRTQATVSALLADLHRQLAECPFSIRTIFVGGGTPTVLPRPGFDQLFAALAEVANTHPVMEFTVEANPATLDADKARILRDAGVNRVSFGVQSFEPAELLVLDRTHRPDSVQASLAIASAAGFEHLSVDLIFGTPGQTAESFTRTLQQAVALPIDHISCYGLTYEPGTALTARRDRGLLRQMDETRERDLFDLAGEFLHKAGFERYEISNFARRLTAAHVPSSHTPGDAALAACHHNLVYWNNQPYLGIGPSAVGFVNGERRKNVANLREYLMLMQSQNHAVIDRECRDVDGFAADLAWLRLRLTAGIDVARFHERTGINPRERYAHAIARHTRNALLEDTGTHLRLRPMGIPLANFVSCDFV